MNHLKKIKYIILLFLIFSLSGCTNKEDENKLQSILNDISISESTYENIELPLSYQNASAKWYSSNPEIISDDGIVNLPNIDSIVTLKLVLSLNNASKEKEFEVLVYSKDNPFVIETKLRQDVEKFEIESVTSENLNLVTTYQNASVYWSSSDTSIIANSGVIRRGYVDETVTLKAEFRINEISIFKSFEVTVLKYSDYEIVNMIIDKITLPNLTYFGLEEEMEVDVPDGFMVSWTSSDESIIDLNGKVTRQDERKKVLLTVEISNKEEIKVNKEFEVMVCSNKEMLPKDHQIIDRANDFSEELFNNVKLEDNKLVLDNDELVGSYESKEIKTINFKSLIASWAAISSTTSTVELMVKVKVGEKWSDYITYGSWGFGLQNKCYDQNNGIIKLSDDEVIVINGVASSIQYKVILKRNNIDDESPKLSLVSFALESNNYKFKVDISDLTKEKIYDVPKLYQNEVPSIGNSICSPTTSTMLLKYKGEDFKEFDEYEHRYIAYKFKEYNSGIFGNWVYNCVGMSSFGYDTYVSRMYSIDELVYHLATVGPCGLSVKGQMTSSEKNYYTNGHLIVAIGYKYIDDVLYIVCNDPNVPNVYCEYSINVIKNTWRNVAYVIE